MKRRAFASVGICVGLVVAAGASMATADPTVHGIVHIRNSAPAFHGNVGAENETCEGPRTVKMWERKRNGERKLLGKGMTELNGHWEILVDPLESGSYFATAPEWKFYDELLDEHWTCLRAKSRTLVVD